MYLTQTVHQAVQQTPAAPMTVHGHRVRTAAESAERVARLAGAFRSLGVAPGDRIAALAMNSDRYHEYLLATPWAGAVVLPLNVRWSPAEIVHALRESATGVLLVDDTFAPLVPSLRAELDDLATVIFCGDGDPPQGMIGYERLIVDGTPAEDARRGGDELFGIFYTGGTTGHPKGVMLTHRNLAASALGSLATGQFLTPRGRLLHAAPMFHLADIAAWTAGMIVGSTHVIIPAFTPAGALEAIQRHRVTDTLWVPTMIQLAIDHPDVLSYDLSSVEHLVYGASPISEAVLERARAVFSRAGFVQAYGMTELSPIATLLLPADHDDPALRRAAGRAAPHSEVRVVDAHGAEVPRGTVGEIVVRGDHVTPGYWRREEETAAALRGGWMHTGDGGYMDERGYVFVVDRIKDMIVSGGENVYSAEVENALAKHPAVAACAVIGVPDERWGERVHAVVVLRPGLAATEEELREFCRDRIAGYKLPRSVAFAGELPLSGAGKILKRELRRRYWSGGARQVS
ncbi:Long-chain-fatty-acid--CoA ligase [[Actinomadura] parvosata subsp. kistnae]|uniref:long-chain-fatty-acid--CoA ligase n=1 Tax=[Actinomadura] parvosata TaxID=1955412 RepID=UPI000D27D495|nr:Long-chain-fatty-acid--CoA ligase [Actinomadura parvosata subsp. kistnae]